MKIRLLRRSSASIHYCDTGSPWYRSSVGLSRELQSSASYSGAILRRITNKRKPLCWDNMTQYDVVLNDMMHIIEFELRHNIQWLCHSTFNFIIPITHLIIQFTSLPFSFSPHLLLFHEHLSAPVLQCSSAGFLEPSGWRLQLQLLLLRLMDNGQAITLDSELAAEASNWFLERKAKETLSSLVSLSPFGNASLSTTMRAFCCSRHHHQQWIGNHT